MSVKDRVKEYLAFKNMKVSSFEKEIGVSNSYVNNIVSSIPPKKIKTIREKFPDLSIDWLITGEGEMIHLEGKSLDENFVSERSTEYKRDTVTQMPESDYMEVEFRDLSVAAGPLSRNANRTQKTMLVPREYDRGEYLVVRVDGPSMDDGSIYSIPNGANILIKRIYLENGDRLPIRDNIFVIDAIDGQALKQITEHNTELGYIVCHSYNPEFKDYTVPMDEIQGIYIFRKIVGFRPPIRDIN